MHIGFIFIMIGCSIIFIDKVSASINDYVKDIDKSNEIVDKVDFNYNEFKNKSVIVKDSIVEVSKSFVIYLEEFPSVNVEIKEKVLTVEKEINDLNPIIDELLNYCHYDLNNSKMNSQCESFKINLSNMMESYDKMIEVYNDVIGEYNVYSVANGKEQMLEYNNNINSSIVEAVKELK